jgi:hypothetical protein
MADDGHHGMQQTPMTEQKHERKRISFNLLKNDKQNQSELAVYVQERYR